MNDLLSDEQMQQFIRDGFVTIRLDVPESFHQYIRSQMDHLLEREYNPGNNLLPRIPELAQVYENSAVAGALESVLGPNYQMEDHRHPHVNKPHSEPQKIHKDGARRGDHRVRRAFGFYYPQDTPESHGPTGVLPGSHYFDELPGETPMLPLVADAGVVVIAHYEIWHLAMANNEDRARYMMKFQFTRTEEPQSPSWNLMESDWSTDQQMHQAMWGWHQGTASTDGPSTNGELDREDLLTSLNDGSEGVRHEAAYGLAALAEVDEKDAIVDDLMAVLTGPCAEAGQSAVYGLAAIGERAVNRLIPLLKDSDEDALRFAAHALSEMGTEAAGAESALRDTLQHEDPAIRRRVAEALGNCEGAETDVTVPVLVKMLTDPEDRVRRAAAASVARLAGRLGAGASSDLIQELKVALSNENRYVRGLAAKGLERIGTPEALEIAIDWLHVSRWCPLTTEESRF